MPISDKSSGGYESIVGMFPKVGGTYADVQAIYAKAAGVYGLVFSGQAYPAQFFVNLSNAVNGVITDSQSVVTIQSNPIIPSVSVSRTSGKAPLAVSLDASGTRSGVVTNTFAHMFYKWDFGDGRSTFWAYGPTLFDKNEAFGPIADHVYTEPGTYTWTLTILDIFGNVNTTTGSITATAWAQADTYYIDNGATPAPGAGGVPADAVLANCINATSWSGSGASSVTTYWAANKRVLCKRGASWACTTTTYLPTGCEVGAYGTGADPVVTSASSTQTPFGMTAGPSDVRITNFKHTGPGPNVADSGMVATTVAPSTNLLLMNLESDGSTWGYLAAIADCQETFIHGCNFHGYGTTGLSNNIALYTTHSFGMYVRGSSFDQAPSHVVRFSGAQRLVFDSNKIRRPDGSNAGRHALTLRGIGDGSAIWPGQYTEKCIISNNDIDVSDTTSQWSLQIAPQNTGVGERLRNIIVERNVVKSQYIPMYFQVSHDLVVRDNITQTLDEYTSILIENTNTTGTPSSDNAEIYNNTLYKTGTGPYVGLALRDGVSGTLLKNTLMYAPASSGQTAYSITSGAVAPTVAANSSDGQIAGTRPWASVSPTAAADFTPNSYAVDSGVSVETFIDILGEEITGTRSIGAIQ